MVFSERAMHQNEWAAISLTMFDGIVSTSRLLIGRLNAQLYLDFFITYDFVIEPPQAFLRSIACYLFQPLGKEYRCFQREAHSHNESDFKLGGQPYHGILSWS